MSPELTAVAIAVAVLGGTLAQSVTGIGFVLVSGGTLTALLGPSEGVVLAISLSMVVNVLVLARTHRHVLWRYAVAMLVPAALTAPLGGQLVEAVPTDVLTRVIGGVIVVGVSVLAFGIRVRRLRGYPGAVLAGSASGLMNIIAGVGAPAPAMFATNVRWSHLTTVGTLQVLFVVNNVMAVIVLGPPHYQHHTILPAVGALVVGLVIGGHIARRLTERTARRAVLGLAGASGIALLIAGA